MDCNTSTFLQLARNMARVFTSLVILQLFAFVPCSLLAQTNVGLTATATHSGGGAGSYAATNYNDGTIATSSGCSSSATPWGWVSTNGWIEYTWSSPATFNKIVLYKSNRPMTTCQMQYWSGSAYVTFLSYSGTTCTQDSVEFDAVTTTKLRFNTVAGSSNPNHREIQVWQTAPPPPDITGVLTYCAGGTISLTASSAAPSPQYYWTGPASFTHTGATISISSITAANAGSYTCVVTSGGGAPSDPSSAVVAINPMPATIAGTAIVCIGNTTTLSNATSGGTWISGTTSVATISSGGVVSGISEGTSLITYKLTSTGCQNTRLYSVNPLPAAITGTDAVCLGGSTTFSTTDVGGTWSSANVTVADIDPSSGLATSSAVGIAGIAYTLPTGCVGSINLSVNPLPAITMSPTGPTTICLGETTTFTAISPDPVFNLLNENFDAGLTGWNIQNLAGVPASYWQIVPPPGADGTPGDGTPMMQAASSLTSGFTHSILSSPSFSTLGFGSATLRFNQYLLSTVPDVHALIEYSINGGATWSTISEQVGAFAGTGSWTAGSPEFSMPLPAAAIGEADVMIRFNYEASSFYWFIDNISVTANLPPSTFVWTGDLGLSCTTCNNPDITPTSTGANTYSVTVTSSAGCTSTSNVTVNVNSLPGIITGNLNVCVGTTFMLSNSAAGGVWAVSNPAAATIVSSTGAITGIGAGTTTVSYTLPTGCFITAIATVAPAPAAISGADNVCEGLNTSLTHLVSGGAWDINPITTANINSFGTVDGLVNGTATVTYTLPSGCKVWKSMTVNPSPDVIAGVAVLCQGATSSLSNSTAGGFWTSGSIGVATINSLGTITGIANGNSIISYSLPTGCSETRIVTVNALPATIAGATTVCQGSSAIVTNATAGGTWTSTDPSKASIDASGIVTGMSAGIVAISYTFSATGCAVATPFTVNALPTDITGLNEVCVGDLIAKVSSPSGGTWTSSGPATLGIDPSTGVATGMANGVATVTYTLGTGCRKTAAVSVNALPVPITGTFEVCQGQSATVYDFTPGGGWSSGNTAIADISSTGVITGVSQGMAQISYTLGTGCLRTQIVTIDPLPGAITGSFQVCQGQTTALGNTDAGGIWSSSNPSVTSVSIGGVVTGTSAGVSIITYTLPTGCRNTQMVTVNALPGSITGPSSVCEGASITFGNAVSGGLWIPENPSIATVSAAGVVTGVDDGTTNITYTLPTGCARIRSVVVNITPDAISGVTQVCTGLSQLLSGTPTGGVWTSASSFIAPVDMSGTVTGATPGSTNISYTLSTGCRTISSFIVNALPLPITGLMNVCVGGNTTLTSASTGGTWNIATPFNASIDMTTGVVSGLNDGNALVTYTLPTTCKRTATVVVNPLPAPIFGVLNVCAGATTSLTDITPGGTWSTSAAAIATISSSGLVIGITPGIANIYYTLPTTCRATASVVVNAVPAAITGTTVVCMGQTTTLSNATPGGNWLSDDPGIASVDAAGVVTGNAAGTTNIRYYFTSGCEKSTIVIVNPLPSAITGNMNICMGTPTVLSNANAGGTWTSSDPAVAPINIASGIATGASVGFSIITYTLPTGCIKTASLIINDLPEAITGTMIVCANGTSLLDNATPGGTWSSSSSVAMINAAGMVTGIAAGTARITYTIGNSCRRISEFSVNPLPALILGSGSVCPGLTTVYTNANPGGTWTSDDDMTATVGSFSGIISGMASGLANITYTLPTGCMRAKSVTVHPSVDAITGAANVCKGSSILLDNATAGGVWISGTTSIATVGAATGLLTGTNAGSALITYTLPTGCMTTALIQVNPLPAATTGIMSVCEGAMVTLTNTSVGGSWTSSDDAIATIDGMGMVSGITAGDMFITYTLPTGCSRADGLVVNPLPAMSTVNGGGSYCAGGAGVNIGLDGSEAGTTYTLHRSIFSIGTTAGTGTSISFGMKTVAGTYTVTASTAAGCSADMAGSAVINVSPLITPTVFMMSDLGDSVCDGTTTTFTATGIDGGTTPVYTWSVGGTAVGTGTTYSYTPANGDMVMVTFTSSEICPSVSTVSAMKSITVIPNLTPAVAITVAPDDTLCEGQTAMLTAAITNGGTAPLYTWVVSGSIIPGATNASYSFVPANLQTVLCKLNSNYRCPAMNNVSSNTVTMHIEPKYTPLVDIVADPGTTVHKYQTVNFTTVVTNAGPSPRYQWLIRGGIVTGATNATFTTNDLYNGDSVTCRVYGSGECGLLTINSVVMEVLPVTGVLPSAASESNINLVPNPNNGDFVIRGTLNAAGSDLLTVDVTDMLGKVVYSNIIALKNGRVEEQVHLGNTLSSGMFLVNVHTTTDRKVFQMVIRK